MKAVDAVRGRSWFRLGLIVIATGWCAATPAAAGTEVLLYPLARAFGSPSETELAKCREAFRAFQTERSTMPVALAPVLVMNADARPPRGEWRMDLAEAFRNAAQKNENLPWQIERMAPDVAFPVLGRNQLRHAWQRADVYAASVKSARREHPCCFTEVWVARDHIIALHVFIVSGSGQLLYCRWFNSHQFGPKLAFAEAAWIEFLVPRILRDLRRPADEIFPPYGVG